MPIADGIYWCPDVSRYQKNLTDDQWSIIINLGADGLIYKIGQNTFEDAGAETHDARAVQFSLPPVLYFWPDPIYSLEPQISNLTTLLKKYPGRSVAFDYEQWWANWSHYYEYLRGQRTKEQVARLEPDRIETFYNNFATRAFEVVRDYRVPTIAYSAKWFDFEMPTGGLGRLVNRHDHYWHAQYIFFQDPDGDGVMSPQEFWDHLNRLEEYGNPSLPNGVSEYSIWQVSSNLPLAGLPSLDINIIKESKYTDIFGEAPPPPLPGGDEITYKFLYTITKASTLNARSKISTDPSTDYGDIKYLSTLPIVRERDGWGLAKFWVHLGYGTRKEV